MALTKRLSANNVRSSLAGAISAVATTMTVQSGIGATLPSPNNAIGEYFDFTIQDQATGLRVEIVAVTAVVGDLLTIVRGQQSTTGQAWNAGDTCFLGVTKGAYDSWVQPSQVQSGQFTYAAAAGSTTAYTAALSPVPAVLTGGMFVSIDTTSVGTNTTTTPTFALNGLTAYTIVKQGGALRVGDMPKIAQLQYNAALTKWLLLNPDNSANQVPTGTVFPYASAISAPTGYVFTNGAALSRTTYADLFKLLVTDQGYTAQTFTCTIANPAVFTKTAHGFTNGERLRLSTTGALPTGLNTTADYFVEKLTNDTFYLTTSVFGIATRVITTGTQSGTHSYLQSLYGLGDGSTTFNAPDTRGLFIRGLDAGRGIDANRTIGTTQKGTLQVLDTNTGGGADGMWCLSTSLSTTLAQLQNSMGVDGYTLTDYPFINIGSIAPTTTQSLPGLFGTQCGTGIGRPSNIAMPYIIKY